MTTLGTSLNQSFEQGLAYNNRMPGQTSFNLNPKP